MDNNNEKQNIDIALIKKDLHYIKESIDKCHKAIDNLGKTYVSKEEFNPIKRMFGKLSQMGIGILILIGGIGLFFIDFVKDKLLK